MSNARLVLACLVLSIVGLLLIGIGCQSQNQDPTHKDTFILASRIAINHLEYERDMEYLECQDIPVLNS